jgi:uncharacterized protein YprB with RNaseH-like and TPR domain
MDIYIDCEWFVPDKLFLIGYAYNQREFTHLYEKTLTKENLFKMFAPVDGYVFFYGPDISILEKHFNINIRNNKKCVNLIRVFRKYEPDLSSYKLCSLEWYYGIKRNSEAYKANIFTFLHDWYKPEKRKAALEYNKEDVINLIKVKKYFFADHRIKSNMIKDMLLK